MSQFKILNLAYMAQLEIWHKEREFLEEFPNNEFAQVREKKAWDELNEISEMMKAYVKAE